MRGAGPDPCKRQFGMRQHRLARGAAGFPVAGACRLPAKRAGHGRLHGVGLFRILKHGGELLCIGAALFATRAEQGLRDPIDIGRCHALGISLNEG
ncbi:hypothetical protein D3C86_1896000 [compost metagenome]